MKPVQALPSSLKPVRNDLNVEALLDCIAGAYLAERARNGAVAPGWAQRVPRTLLPAVASHSAQPSSGTETRR
jgi:hypothetical protein